MQTVRSIALPYLCLTVFKKKLRVLNKVFELGFFFISKWLKTALHIEAILLMSPWAFFINVYLSFFQVWVCLVTTRPQTGAVHLFSSSAAFFSSYLWSSPPGVFICFPSKKTSLSENLFWLPLHYHTASLVIDYQDIVIAGRTAMLP